MSDPGGRKIHRPRPSTAARGLFALFLAALVACSSEQRRDPTPAEAPAVLYPVHELKDSATADLRGTLVIRDACLLLATDDGSDPMLPVWPAWSRFAAAVDGGSILDGNGNVVARVGEAVRAGGGEVPRDFAEEVAGRKLPAGCGGSVRYVLVGDILPSADPSD